VASQALKYVKEMNMQRSGCGSLGQTENLRDGADVTWRGTGFQTH